MNTQPEKCSTSKLWSIYISGMDEYHPAPSEAAAKHMAEKHNDALNAFFERHPEMADMATAGMGSAAVEEWPFEAEDHAEDLKSFDYAGWGLEGDAA